MTQKLPPVLPSVEQCVLPGIAQAPVLAPLPQYRRLPWNPLPRNPL